RARTASTSERPPGPPAGHSRAPARTPKIDRSDALSPNPPSQPDGSPEGSSPARVAQRRIQASRITPLRQACLIQIEAYFVNRNLLIRRRERAVHTNKRYIAAPVAQIPRPRRGDDRPHQPSVPARGTPGMTAYFGLLDIARPAAGETVVVSGAAGAVGGLVGQIAKLKGCRVVGIAGGGEKCSHALSELGFDAMVDYKAQDVEAALREHCPAGIDVYFDNVGGAILDAALGSLARHARVVICGAISQYNSSDGFRGPSNYMSLLVNHA